MVQSDKLKKIIAEVKEESSPVITLSNELIADFSKELDSAISEFDYGKHRRKLYRGYTR